MKPFQFQLNKTYQSKVVLPYLEAAEKYCDEKGLFGAVFCQIEREHGCGPITVSGTMIPEEYAVRINEILEEYRKSAGEE